MANIFHIDRPTNKIILGTTGTTINIASHTASRLLALDASKNLESITDLIVDTTNHRVGIGTTTPSLKLDVKGMANTSYTNCPLLMQVHTLDAYAAGMGGGISLGGEYGSVNTTTFGYIAGLKENADEGDYAGKLVFGTRVDGSGAADFTRMTILSTGNVGIGKIPDSKLDVAGAISSSTMTIHPSGQTNNTDVSGVNTLFLDLDGGENALISGFTGGVAGQVLRVTIIDHTKTVTLQHLEGLSTQELYLCDDGDETLDDFGGWVLICNGSHWYDCGHAKHVA